MGAHVHGYSLAPPTNPCLFDQLRLSERIRHHQIADIRDAETLNEYFQSAQPDVVFHLAAQPLVLASYQKPIDTYQNNLNGTLNVLEALRNLNNSCAALLITTDKVYENDEGGTVCTEDAPLGGSDPYSSSKACCDIAISSWRRSFFADHPVRICSARAGNVIGGGDWAESRLVPDIIRALSRREIVRIRNPNTIRPWQHVLEPLGGYLLTALRMTEGCEVESLNFGPHAEACRAVQELVDECLKHWPGESVVQSIPDAPYETSCITLSIEKAKQVLGWVPKWDFGTMVESTVNWYKQVDEGCQPLQMTQQQVKAYFRQ